LFIYFSKWEWNTKHDTPPNSLMESTTSPKVTTTKGKGVGAHSLTLNTSKVKEHVWVLGWGLKRLTSKLIAHMDLHKPNNKLVNAYLEHFWCTDKPQANTNSQDSSRLEFGESTTFPLIVFFMHGHGASAQMSFYIEILKWRSRNSQNWDSRNFGGP
jgi:hypothetical protein